MPRQTAKRGSHFSGRPTHPVFTFVNLCGQLCPRLVFTKPRTGSTWSCTKRGFSCNAVRRYRLRDHRHYWRCGGLLHHLFTFLSIPSCEETGMCVFCDTFRFCRILPAKPSLSKSETDWTASDRHARHLALWCSDFPPNFIGDEIERLPDAPASASGLKVQLSQQNSYNCIECNYKTIFKWLIISSYLYRDLLNHPLPDSSRAICA